MNVGRLHACLYLIKKEYDDFEIVKKLDLLHGSLQQSINQPSEEATKKFQHNYSNLFNALSESWTNFASPTRIKAFDDIKVSSKIGQGLRDRIEKIISENNITPASALTALLNLINEIGSFNNTITGVIKDFKFLNLKHEDLGPGEYEIGISFPSEIIKSNLEGLSKEMHGLDRHFKTFKEIAEEDTSSIKIRSISTTDLQIFLDSAPIVATLIITSISRIVTIYKNILKIKKIKDELEKLKVPTKLITSLGEYEKTQMKIKIEKMGENLVDEFYDKKDDARKNELKNALGLALRYLAEKIEHGAIIDVRAGEPEKPEPSEAGEKTPQYEREQKGYLKEKERIKQINLKGRCILELKKGDLSLLFLKSKEKKSSENQKK